MAFAVVDNESPTLGDITGDGKPELIFNTDGKLVDHASEALGPLRRALAVSSCTLDCARRHASGARSRGGKPSSAANASIPGSGGRSYSSRSSVAWIFACCRAAASRPSAAARG